MLVILNCEPEIPQDNEMKNIKHLFLFLIMDYQETHSKIPNIIPHEHLNLNPFSSYSLPKHQSTKNRLKFLLGTLYPNTQATTS